MTRYAGTGRRYNSSSQAEERTRYMAPWARTFSRELKERGGASHSSRL